MNRYLINLSYIGTQFRGIQKSFVKGSGCLDDPCSIEGLLEIALRKFRPVNEFKIKLSSRTDAGVHALQNAIHVDLERKNGQPYETDKITKGLNRSFMSQGLPIRIINTSMVPMSFHARLCAISRTYLYRVGVLRREFCDDSHAHEFSRFIPIEEFDRCYFIANPKFDVERLIRVAKQFEGYHDFRTFMAISRGNPRQMDPSYTLRRIEHVSIDRSVSMASVLNRELADKCYEYWNIRIVSRSFLYKQVRRMIGAWIAAAEGRISERDIYEMLTIPSSNSWCNRAVVAPAYGLYLCKVEYNPTDLQFSQDELSGATEEKQAILTSN